MLWHRPVGDKTVHVAPDPYAAVNIASGLVAYGSAHTNVSIHANHTYAGAQNAYVETRDAYVGARNTHFRARAPARCGVRCRPKRRRPGDGGHCACA
jgi:hypothetical protein